MFSAFHQRMWLSLLRERYLSVTRESDSFAPLVLLPAGLLPPFISGLLQQVNKIGDAVFLDPASLV